MGSDRKKFLFVTSRSLWPVDNGRKTSINAYCKGLHDRFGYDVYLYSFVGDGEFVPEPLPYYIKECRRAKRISSGEKIRNIFTRSFGRENWPFQCSLYYSEENAAEIARYCVEMKPDVVCTEMIRTSFYLDAVPDEVKKISNLDDLLSKRYRRQIENGGSNGNIAGSYSSSLPGFLNGLTRLASVKRFVLCAEADRCEKWERRFYDSCDYVMFTSPIETKEINDAMSAKKALTLSVGVDYEDFSREIPEFSKVGASAVFVGNFKVAANVDSLEMIAGDVLPRVKNDVRLYVIGNCPKEIRERYAGNRQVEFTGRVDDLVGTVRRYEVFLAPIAFGTGIKTKIVEAMAMGIPVLTNDVGAEGIPLDDKEGLVIANTADALAEKLDQLLGSSGYRDAVAKQGQEIAFKYFRWDVVFKAFEEAGL